MKLDIDIFNIKTNNLKPRKGRILISEPFLRGYHFSRSIILLTEHNAEGSMGIVLNKPLDLRMGHVMRDVTFSESKLFCGGPVSPDKLFYVHAIKNVPGVIELGRGLYFGGNFDYLKDYLDCNPESLNNIRFFIGYSGWSPNQLEEELKSDSWLVSDILPELVLNTSTDSLWKESVEALGSDYKCWISLPANPEMN